MSGPELKPCPFCGGVARYQPDHKDGCDGIWCLPCDYGMFDPDEHGSVVAAWNTRAPVDYAALPEVQAMIAEAETRALDSVTTLHTVIANIRAATVGGRPMLSDLAQALVAWRDEAVAKEREDCARTVELRAAYALFEDKPGALNAQWADAIRKRGEG